MTKPKVETKLSQEEQEALDKIIKDMTNFSKQRFQSMIEERQIMRKHNKTLTKLADQYMIELT